MSQLRKTQNALQRFIGLEAAGGVVLVAAAVLATIVMNSSSSQAFTALLDRPFALRFGMLVIDRPVILPLFALANAGVDFRALQMPELLVNVRKRIAAGLFIGKQVGVLAGVLLLVKLGFARLPDGASWLQVYGVAILCGIGFTVSLFIGSLAFENQHESYMTSVRVGVLAGSVTSAVVGYAVLRLAPAAARQG